MKKLTVLLAFVLALALCLPALADTGEPERALDEIVEARELFYGTYEQDNDLTNGEEPVEWIVLDVNDMGECLLISKYALDAVSYNTQKTDVTWEKSDIRSWLNRDFYEAAFTAEEKAKILTTFVTADKNPSCDTDPGVDNYDKVFLLSITEANEYFSSDEARMCVPTKTAFANGAWTSDGYKLDDQGTCTWWLRSPGTSKDYAAYVGSGGWTLDLGNNVSNDHCAVRPAIWVKLD